MIEDVEEFEMAGDFLFATKRESSAKNAGLKLWMSYQRKPFQLANFGTDKPVVDYFVTNVTKFGQAVIAVTFDDKRTDVYFCAPNSTNFTKSLDNVLFFHPQQGIGRFSILNQLVVDDATSFMGNSVTKITYDNGATWKVIRALPMDVNRELIKCAVGHACPTLHFTQKFPLFASARNQQTFFSSHHAPGLIIGAGVIGENTADAGGTTNAIFITTDGGHRWRETLKGVYHFAVGDHGGLIVAVNAAGRTQELLYTTDEGANWKGVKIADQRVRILSVLTEPGERQTVFSLFGTLKNESDLRHEWVIITVNLTSVFNGTKCGPTDFKPWTFRPASIGHRCHMGQKVWYTRRAVNRKCLVGRDFQRNVTIENCPCQYYDFECDLGYVPLNNSTILTCVKDPGSTYDPIVLPAGAVCPPGGSWLRSRKFRKPMNTCEGGVSKRYSPEKNMSDLTDMLEVLGSRVTGLAYDHRDKCLFLSEVQRGRIRRICFNGYTSQSILAQQYVDYPVAISFDWMSRNLYWLDRKRGTIEAVNVDSTVDGHMRTIILKDMNLLTEATDFIVFPSGWRHVLDLHPSGRYNSVIYQARLDGTQIRKLTEPRYPRQPDALSFDYHRGKLMYIDHTTFDIGEVTFSSAPDGWDSAIVLRRNQRNRMKFAAFNKNRIYYTAFNHDQLFMTTRGASSSQMMMHVGGNVNVIKAFAPSMQPGSGSWLKNITCHTLRVTMPANETACLCPEGFITNGTRCLCPDRTLPSTHQDGRCPAFESNCTKAQFSCGAIGRTQSMCIPKVWRCDGENDCGNNLDEEDCENTEDSCNPDYHFRCGDGTCIYKDWQCDGGGPDCSDGSDERNCPLTKPCSRADYVRCNISNDQCIPDGWWCDSEEDCDDGSDELHCGYMANFSSTACNPSTEFQCASDSVCVKKEYKCDGDSNCADGSDEIHCPLHNCSTWEFSCANGNCTYTNYICDGMNDCGDNSDELNCTNIADHRATFNCSFKDGDAMDCGDGLCVPLTWKCDGLLDCPNGLDEQGCHESRFEACGLNTTNCLSNGKCVNLSATCDGKEDCPGGEDEHNCPCAAKEFTCGDGVKCIPQSYVCDENLDCPGGEDEGSICDSRPKCGRTQFRCRLSGKCVPLLRVCNSVSDCPHGEDEFGCRF
ncbi:Sortilin-related receptor [Hypsibius exemplaris]|uniref:Sortilin-related receptor n=1 Tax=Hypsibius exemplaris TaxID=2072580 RepID=A0A1W0XEH4_HYPEX|nr:Sortilin-related receptor [Hypsibius exemplaris]